MHPERRESLRLRTSVPCVWRVYDTVPDRSRLLSDFSLTEAGPAVERMLSIDEQMQTVFHADALDGAMRDALALLNDKIDAVAYETLFALPPPVTLELAMGGVRLPEALAMQEGHVLGLHLVLHDQHCFFVAAPCLSTGAPCARFRFSGLPAREQRRLNRFLLLESRTALPLSG